MNRKGVAELAGSVGLGAWTAFGVLAMVVVGGHGAPLYLDDGLLHWSVEHRPEIAIAVARGVTATGTGVIPYALVVLAGLIAGRTARQRLAAVLLAALCLGAGQAVRYGVMELVGRPRPAESDWQTHASGWSFPSGHSTTAALTAGLVILAIAVRAPRGRLPLCLAVGCWGALVGLTRVFLGVHWFTDVIGGWLFAVGWLGVCLCAAAWWLPGRLVPGAGKQARATGAANRTTPPAGIPHPTDPATTPQEDHAPQDPGRRGRSRPA
ncbi:phosphatase PAP2 family protein [Streptomyces sp. NPDC001984]|uniref:phosphatase PAP2 family protein n=1 Tax=Streptomyces sp. NPDC002619 TaxID=3364655 RepID=UPI0036AFD286